MRDPRFGGRHTPGHPTAVVVLAVLVALGLAVGLTIALVGGGEDAGQGSADVEPEPTATTPDTSGAEQTEEPADERPEGGDARQEGSDTGTSGNDAQSTGERTDGGSTNDRSADEGAEEPQDGSLTAEEEDRVEDAADRFVTAVHGYSGNSAEEYTDEVMKTVLANGIYRSPGGARIEENAQAAEQEGLTQAAVMERFDIAGISGNEIEGVAYFERGDAYNRYAELEGDATAYSQQLVLTPAFGSYRVSEAELENEIPNTREE